MFRATTLAAAALFALTGCSSDPTDPGPEPEPPRVEQRATADGPTVPAGMYLLCLADPDRTAPASSCPVLVWNDKTYWAFSFGDNRSAFGIVAYAGDAEVGRIERAGARYLFAMAVNEADSTVTLTGQASRTVTVAWDELP